MIVVNCLDLADDKLLIEQLYKINNLSKQFFILLWLERILLVILGIGI